MSDLLTARAQTARECAITAERAGELLAGATPGTWEAAEIQDGTQTSEELCVVVLNDERAYRKPDGTWHGVYICRGMDGPTRGPNAALCAAAPDLARSVIDLHAALARVTAERDEARRVLRFIDRIADATMRLAETTRFSRARDHDAAAEAYGVFADYGGMLRERRHDARRGIADTAEGALIAEDDLVAVEWRRRPPFDEATTRRLCAFLGCDPQPLLDAAAKCEEAMR